MAAPARLALALLALVHFVGSGCVVGNAAAAKSQKRQYNIRVCARLRPLPPDAPLETGEDHTRIVLPLHQRLQLIRAEENLNRTDAQRRLWASRGGLADPYSVAAVKVPKAGDADVAMTEDGDGGGYWKATQADEGVSPCVLSTTGGPNGYVLMCCPAGAGIRRFTVDHVLNAGESQHATYLASASPTVAEFVGGQNACIFAYGQTGSGKSYTIFGATDEASSAVASKGKVCEEAAGIVPRACTQVLAALADLRAQGRHARVSLSCVEVFGETITDLLATTQPEPLPATAPSRPKAILPAAVLRGRLSVPLEGDEAAECAAALERALRNRS